MAYRVEYDDANDVALKTRPLSEDDYRSLVDALRRAARDPSDRNFCKPTSDVHVRRVEFGVHVVGVAIVFVDPRAEVLKVHDIRWSGG